MGGALKQSRHVGREGAKRETRQRIKQLGVHKAVCASTGGKQRQQSTDGAATAANEQQRARRRIDAFLLGRALSQESIRLAASLLSDALTYATEFASEVQTAASSLEDSALSRAEVELSNSSTLPSPAPALADGSTSTSATTEPSEAAGSEAVSVQAAVDELRASTARARLELTRRR